MAVIGGGNSGIEAAIDLAGIVEHVTVVEFADTLRADDVLQKKARSMGNIDIIMSARTTEVIGDGSKVVGMDYEDRTTGEIKHLAVAGIFVQIGLVPNTEFLKGSEVALTRFGEIEIDTKGATSLPGVYAAGDATTVPFKQIIISMGAGATAALGAFDYLIRNPAPEAQSYPGRCRDRLITAQQNRLPWSRFLSPSLGRQPSAPCGASLSCPLHSPLSLLHQARHSSPALPPLPDPFLAPAPPSWGVGAQV